MSEEKKEPAVKQEQAPQAQPAVSDAKAPEGQVKKNKKISKMTLKEIDEKLISVKEKMGRLDSRYAKELLKRKEMLSGGKKA